MMMDFTGFGFLLYFLPIMLVGYYLLGKFKKVRNIWLILCGLGFYFLNGIACAVLVLTLAVLNHIFGLVLRRLTTEPAETASETDANAVRTSKKAAKRVLWLSIIVNTAPLIVYIFIPQLLGSLQRLFGFELRASLVVPFGITFFALQGISYASDIYRGKITREPDIVNTLVYFTFFPVTFAGPIIKYHEFSEQIEVRAITFDKITDGICRLVVGLAKLCLVAEPLLSISGIVTDRSNLSALYTSAPILLMLLGLVSCITGMYHFFSGFSDAAIGLGKMLGFKLPENFHHPQLATTVTSFWQRCFSTLTGWFEEYVYDSLSKKRSSNDKMVLHLLMMWLLVGLWTGPSMSHLIFGFWNFVFILFERIVEMREKPRTAVFRHLYVMIVMVISVIALNSSGMYQFTMYLSNLFGMKGYGFYDGFAVHVLTENWYVLLMGFITAFPIGTKLRQCADVRKGFFRAGYSVFYPIVMAVLVVLVVLKLSGVSYDPAQLINTYLWS